MSETARFWVYIAGLAAGTFLLRSIPLWLHGNVHPPAWVTRLLKHVPAAVLTALVVPGALYVKLDGAYEFAPARLVAALAAAAVAWKTKNTLITLAVGMGVLWAMQALLASV